MRPWMGLLIFVAALVLAGWYVSQPGAPGWAPVLPTLVIAAGVITGLVYAIRHGLRRRKGMAETAARLGLQFARDKRSEEFRAMGLGALKLFVYCRPVAELSFLQRSVNPGFHNVMSGRETWQDLRADFFLFDYTTSSGRSAPNQRGTFVCFRKAGGTLPDLEIVPRLWGVGPQWLKSLVDAPPVRSELEGQGPAFASEYRAYSADEERAREVLDRGLPRFLSEPAQTGWRIEASGEWVAVTRLGASRKIGGTANPMELDAIPRERRHRYHENTIAPGHIPEFLELARRVFGLLAGV